eukprot:CAMPEP_0194279596 /NCGR_PEP_ID=MMETSP0169-20130528/14019_1 /TAXON_ID=218684 /ORGANISM="Corethron pennatum, Strain L29A3" /LENGTH=416 /DNA_ID=CAMNT_0039024043 /DNA_START=19 /DNA_END=1269 /DNA_ORIENTATION=-
MVPFQISFATFVLLSLSASVADCFQSPFSLARPHVLLKSSTQSTELEKAVAERDTEINEERKRRKDVLLSLLRCSIPGDDNCDPVLVDPTSKLPLYISASSPNMNGSGPGQQSVKLKTKGNGASYGGRTDTFYDLLTPIVDGTDSDIEEKKGPRYAARRLLLPLIPPPLRSALSALDSENADEYVPMRDLFTSPTVSYAYERGWRQGFAAAGFPGADKEFDMAVKYFEECIPDAGSVLVDMSCATGLFTRRFATSGRYARVIGADYSESMLSEARRRISQERLTREQGGIVTGTDGRTTLELVRLDVGNIPMADESIDALHAGAAMHCWPDINGGLSEIHRVLKPGGRYFATTFLSDYFKALQRSDPDVSNLQSQAFQYFESSDELEKMMIAAGFDPEKVTVEVLGQACAVIRCEK